MKFFFLLASLIIASQLPLRAQWQLSGIVGQNVHGLLTDGVIAYAGCDSGVYRSTNDGLTWGRRSTGLPVSPFFTKTFAMTGSSLFAGTNGAAGMYVTTNDGVTWTVSNSGLTGSQVHALAVQGSVLFAATNGNGIFRSTNNGALWLESNVGINNLFAHSLLVTASRIMAGTDGGAFVSADTGATWSLLPGSPTDIRSLASTGSLLVAGTNTAGIFRSTDNGLTWSGANVGLASLFVRVVLAQGTNLFAGTKSGGVHLSTDDGANWSQINNGLDSLSILALEVNATTLYAGADRGGVWTRPLSQVVAAPRESALAPSVFRLQQNYPNPFNPSTVIRYSIPTRSHVVMKVYDVLGRDVATLVDDMRSAGEYSVRWNAANVASGVYFCRLTNENRVEVREMMIVK